MLWLMARVGTKIDRGVVAVGHGGVNIVLAKSVVPLVTGRFGLGLFHLPAVHQIRCTFFGPVSPHIEGCLV